jgi:hypothetical protein
VPRSTYYYSPRPESAETLRLLRKLDQLYLDRPFFGSRKMAIELNVNRKRAQRLVRILERGTHEKLLAAGGLYSQLYSLQFREEDRVAVEKT